MEYATLIGDVILSRKEPDQEKLLLNIGKALEEVNRLLPAAQALTMTIGDEFQGAYGEMEKALEATLLIRLVLGKQPELRMGLAWGRISASDPEALPLGQSGPGWWNAREAIEKVKKLEKKRGWPRTLRTWIEDPEGRFDALNAFLLCRDQVLQGMDDKDRRIALGLFLGESQRDLSRVLGIQQPTVSKRLTGGGAMALFRAHRLLSRAVPDVS